MEWISIKDRMPEDYQRILYWNNSKELPFGYCEIGYFVSSQTKVPKHITHWMPLPEPPKL